MALRRAGSRSDPSCECAGPNQGANHFFDGKIEPLMQAVGAYLDKRLKGERKSARRAPRRVPAQTATGGWSAFTCNRASRCVWHVLWHRSATGVAPPAPRQ
jgi:hypothetical protein